MADAHTNFAYALIASAPAPPASGTSLSVTAGLGAIFPTPPFNATVWPAGVQPLTTNAEIVRVTGIAADTFTVTRTQESSSARTILVGDQIAATITVKTLTDVEALSLPSGVTRGALLYGNSTPASAWLPVGTANRVLSTDGTDVIWGSATGTSSVVRAIGATISSPTLISADLGTPSSGVLTNCTGFPAASLAGLGANVATFLATPSSANLAAALTDETGTGANVFANTPTLVTPILGVASGTSLTLSGLTNKRVTYAGPSGILSGDSRFLWDDNFLGTGIGVLSLGSGIFYGARADIAGGTNQIALALRITSANYGLIQALDENGDVRFGLAPANTFWFAAPATASVTLKNSPGFQLMRTWWDGAASQQDGMGWSTTSLVTSAGGCAQSMIDTLGVGIISGSGTGRQIGINWGIPSAGFVGFGQLFVNIQSSGNTGVGVWGASGQTSPLFRGYDSALSTAVDITAGGGFIFNEQGIDTDSRVEGDTDANLLYIDAGNDFVGIGTPSPSDKFSVVAKFDVSAVGLVTKYNNIATVKNGVPSLLATIDSTGLTANVGATTLYAVPASGEGMYRVSVMLVTTTAGSVSSTMPNAQVVYTDKDSNTSVTLDVSPILGAAGLGQSGLLTANTVGTVFTGVVVIYVKLSTTIQYQTVNYASTAAGMAYALRIRLEAL